MSSYYQPAQYKGLLRVYAVFSIGFIKWVHFLRPVPGHFVGRRERFAFLSPRVGASNQGQVWLVQNQEDYEDWVEDEAAFQEWQNELMDEFCNPCKEP